MARLTYGWNGPRAGTTGGVLATLAQSDFYDPYRTSKRWYKYSGACAFINHAIIHPRSTRQAPNEVSDVLLMSRRRRRRLVCRAPRWCGPARC